MDSLFLTDKRLRNSINGIAVTEYKSDTKNVKRRRKYYELLTELGLSIQDGELALEARKAIMKRRLVLQWHMVAQLREEFSPIEGVCMVAMPLNEPLPMLNARMGYVEPTKRQFEFLTKRYKYHEKQLVDYGYPVPLFSLELLQVGLGMEDVLCKCGKGFLYAPGRCLSCHPLSGKKELVAVWKKIWEQVYGETDFVYHTERGCYLKMRKLDNIKTDSFQKKLEMLKGKKP